MKIFLRLLRFVKPYYHFVPEYVFHSIFSILFGLLNYTLLIPLLNILFNTEKVIKLTKPKFNFSVGYISTMFKYTIQELNQGKGPIFSLFLICSIIFVGVLISNFFKYMCLRVIARMKVKLVENVRNALFTALINQDLDFYYKNKKGNSISVLINDVQELESGVGNTVQNLLRAPLIIIFYMAVLFYISVPLTLFTIMFFPLSGLLISNTVKKLKKRGYFSQELLGKILSCAEEAFSGIKVIKAFIFQRGILSNFYSINRKFSVISRANFSQRDLASPLSEFLGVSIMLVLVLYGGYLILTKGTYLTGASFIAYLAIYSQMLPPLKDLSNCFSYIPKAIASGERIFKIIDSPVRVNNSLGNIIRKNCFDRKIEFINVKFKYKDHWILNDVSFTINKGETVAFVGSSGSGKTTIADLLFRFYDVQEGEILIDGINIKSIDQTDLQKLIGIVTQDPFLFNDTVFNNITFGTKKTNVNVEEEVKKVASISFSHDFIMNLENKYYTNVGDRGMKLSGGQRQRVTIARALYKNSPILIFDEATASLDSESESHVQKALENAIQNRTSIVIAHRLSTIKNADKIIVLDKGRVREMGTHKELIDKQGIYNAFIKKQEVK